MAAKTRAAELRVPMRRFIEEALESAVNPDSAAFAASIDAAAAPEPVPPSIWDDPYIDAQAHQPLGSPLDISEDEARRVALGAFGASIETEEPISSSRRQRLKHRAYGDVGDPIDLSDEGAAQFLRDAFSFGAFGSSEAGYG